MCVMCTYVCIFILFSFILAKTCVSAGFFLGAEMGERKKMYSVLPYVLKLCLTKFRLYKVFDYIFSQNEIKYSRYSFNKMTKDNRY